MWAEWKQTCLAPRSNGRRPSERRQAGTHHDWVAQTPVVCSYCACRVPPARDSQTVSSDPWDWAREASAATSQYSSPGIPCSIWGRRSDPGEEGPSPQTALSARKCRPNTCMADCRWPGPDSPRQPFGQYLTQKQEQILIELWFYIPLDTK